MKSRQEREHKDLAMMEDYLESLEMIEQPQGGMIDRIIAILKKHEKHLSDGFDYYLPRWIPEHGDIEQDEFLRIVAEEIVHAVLAAHYATRGEEKNEVDWSSLSWKEPHPPLSEIGLGPWPKEEEGEDDPQASG